MTLSSLDFYELSRKSLALALRHDENKNYSEAIDSYTQAGEDALRGIRLDRNPSSRSTMLLRANQWIGRAEFLKTSILLSSVPRVPHHHRSHQQDTIDHQVIGMESVKQSLREAILLPQTQPHVFVENRKPWNGILLFGPPGTGKTNIAKAISKESSLCDFISVSSSDIVSKYSGDSEKAIRELFQRARMSPKPRCVLFFDEIEALGRKRQDDDTTRSRAVLSELLTQMDGLGSGNKKVLVIGATNLPHLLDPALRRRFEKRLFVPLPSLPNRVSLLARYLGSPSCEGTAVHAFTWRDIFQLAKRTRLFSGADIASLCNEILLRPLRKCVQAKYFTYTWDGHITPCLDHSLFGFKATMMDPDFQADKLSVPLATIYDAEAALCHIKPSVGAQEMSALLEFQKQFGDDDYKVGVEDVSEDSVKKLVFREWKTSEEESTNCLERAFSRVMSSVTG